MDNLEQSSSSIPMDETETLRQRIAELETHVATQQQTITNVEHERDMFQNILDRLPAIVYLQDSDYNVKFANRYFREHLGDPSSRRCHEIFFGNNEPCDICPISHVFKYPDIAQVWETSPINERIYQIHYHAYQDDEGNPLVLEMGLDITERKKAEKQEKQLRKDLENRVAQRTQELQQSQTLLQELIGNSTSVIYIKDIDGRYILANQQYEKLIGLSSEEMKGKTDYDLFSKEIADGVRGIDQQVIEMGHSIEAEEQVCFDDNMYTYVSVKFPIYDADGHFHAIGGISTDITTRKQAEEELQLFKTVLENAADAIGFTDQNGIITFSNKAHRALFGYGDDIIGTHVAALLVPEAMEVLQAGMQEVMEHGFWLGESINKHKDGTTFPVEVSIFTVPDSNGVIQVVVGFTRDISDRKQVEQDLRTFKALAEYAPDGIAISDMQGIITYVNSSHEKITGYIGEAIGMQIPQFYAPDTLEILPQVLQTIQQEGVWQGELNHVRKDGSTFIGNASGFLLRDNNGNPQNMVAIFRDVSEQKAMEAERLELQQQLIDAQQAAIRELSTPLIPLTNHVVLMPMIGSIDSQRAQQIMETLLEGVATNQADTAIVDITGVSVVDTQVANAIVQAAQAVQLLGAQVVLTGIGPAMAQTLVQLGADLSSIQTRGSLQGAISYILAKRKI